MNRASEKLGSGILVGNAEVDHEAGVLVHRDLGQVRRGDDRSVIAFRGVDREVLGHGSARYADLDVVEVVAIRTARVFEIRRIDEGQQTRGGVE